ncbi:MAG: nitroreductase family protein, partial [bacterium]
MNVREAVHRRRSIRRFLRKPVPRELLERFADAARMAPSANNLQPWEFVIVDDPGTVAEIFPCLLWAGYIAPAGDPPEGERPAAYIVVLLNGRVRSAGGEHDAGAAVQNVLLTAVEEGVGSCWVGSVNRTKAAEILGIPEHCRIDSVIALGYPAE